MPAIALGEKGSLDPSAVGHKAANLARFIASFRVPPGFCLSTSVYDELRPALAPAGAAERETLRRAVAEAYERLAAKLGLPDPCVAVRSSATGEDSADASFAGQHETVLNASGVDAVVEAVLACWRSAGNERVTAYRKEKGIDAPVEVAVLVQQMVDADVSAIAFGVDPVSGDREVVIDAAVGLGDKISAGEITPDRYTVRRADLTVTNASGPALTTAQAQEIARLVLALERQNGHEVDVECAFAKGDLYLLQCRPITTLAAAFPVEWAHPDDAKLHWRRDDVYRREPLPRLLHDYILNGWQFGMRARAEHDDHPLLNRLEPFCGRMYLATQRRHVEGDLGEHLRGATARVRARARTWRRVWDDEYVPRLHAHYAWYEAVTARVAALPRAELADGWDEAWPRLNDIGWMHMITTGAAYAILNELAETYEKLTGGTTVDALKLVQGRAPALHQLERDLHRLGALRARGESAALDAAMTAFIATHGNLGNDGEGLRQLAWRDDPGLLFAELDRRATMPREDPDARLARLLAQSDEIETRTRALLRDRPADLAAFDEILAAARATGPLTEEHNYHLDRQIQTLFGRLIRRVGDRLAADGLLASRDDVYLFHATEITTALRDGRALHALAKERAAEYAGWKRLRHPRTLGGPPPQTLAAANMARVGLGYIAKQDTAGVITGVAASSGVRRGPAKLVRSTDDFPKMTRGDVLVCRGSNVSWIPLFTVASALVTDFGGALSHAAVIAREFGLPAVVGCQVALSTLRDGQLVEVDGDRGTVRPLDRGVRVSG